MKNPCRGCDKRTPFCHIPGNCVQEPTYHDWKSKIEAAKQMKVKATIVTDFLVENIRRTKRLRNLREE